MTTSSFQDMINEINELMGDNGEEDAPAITFIGDGVNIRTLGMEINGEMGKTRTVTTEGKGLDDPFTLAAVRGMQAYLTAYPWADIHEGSRTRSMLYMVRAIREDVAKITNVAYEDIDKAYWNLVSTVDKQDKAWKECGCQATAIRVYSALSLVNYRLRDLAVPAAIAKLIGNSTVEAERIGSAGIFIINEINGMSDKYGDNIFDLNDREDPHDELETKYDLKRCPNTNRPDA